MKHNSYVYPYLPFKDLADKDVRWTLDDPRTYSLNDLKSLLQDLPSLEPMATGGTTAERILSIFLDKTILFGPSEFITDLAQDWLRAIDVFTSRDEPLRFTLLGFPFKIPVNLKTDRTLPDMGELLILNRLNAIAEIVHDIYPPGATITVFTEGAFGPFVDVDKAEADAYAQALDQMISDFAFDKRVKVRALSEMEHMVPDFNKVFETKVSECEMLFRTQDPDFMKKFNGAYDSIYRIISTRDYPDTDVMDAYNNDLKDNELSPQALDIRRRIQHRVAGSVIRYHAYLGVRDDIGFLQKAVPHSLALSVSPKPKRLGIIPVNEQSQRLPYHGVAVFDRQKKDFTIQYLIDLKRDPRAYTPVYYENDKEDKPFYYSV